MNMDEAQGFKSEIGKKKAFNKRRKQDAKTQKQRRQDKIDSLNQNSRSWLGLEGRDIRTPAVYFQNREIDERRVEAIKEKLDDLTEYLQDLKKNPSSTPATKELASKEIGKLRRRKEIKNAVKIVNRIESNDTNEVVDQIKDSLDERIHRRIEPYLELAGSDIAKQIFR